MHPIKHSIDQVTSVQKQYQESDAIRKLKEYFTLTKSCIHYTL